MFKKIQGKIIYERSGVCRMNTMKQTITWRTSRGWETNDPIGVFNTLYVALRTVYKLRKSRSIDRDYKL
jgi:hypothetical protein